MGIFFLAAAATFLLGRALGSVQPRPAREPAWWPPLAVAAAIGAGVLAWSMVSAWILARDADSARAVAAAIAAVADLGKAEAGTFLGGALAGVILYEGFRRAPRMPRDDAEFAAVQDKPWDYVKGSRTAAGAILAGVLFLVVALLAQPGILNRLRTLDAGGVKIELLPGEANAPRASGLGPPIGQFIGENPSRDPFPYLALMLNLVDLEGSGLIARDAAIINRLRNAPPETVPAEIALLKAHRDFLEIIRPGLRCTERYVQASGDGRLIAIRGVDIALRLAVLERALRGGGATGPARDAARENSQILLRRFRELAVEMRGYLNAAGATEQESAACVLPVPNDEAVSAALEKLWEAGSGDAPYLTLAAAWLGGAYQAPSFAVRTLLEWLDKHPTASEPARQWFRVRVLIQLVNGLPEAGGGAPESSMARLALERTLEEFGLLPGLPPLARYDRATVSGKATACPGLHGVAAGPVDASLFYTRIFLIARLLHAVVDNPDPDRRLNARHLRLAAELRAVDLACLPSSTTEVDRGALDAIHRVTFSRVAFAWAAEGRAAGLVGEGEAVELRRQGRQSLAGGRADLEGLLQQWRNGEKMRQARLPDQFLVPFDYMPDLERARRLDADAAARGW